MCEGAADTRPAVCYSSNMSRGDQTTEAVLQLIEANGYAVRTEHAAAAVALVAKHRETGKYQAARELADAVGVDLADG